MTVIRRQGPSEEDKRGMKEELDPKPWLKGVGETYYVVEKNNRYVDGVRAIYVDDNLYEVQISTTKSLLECDRYSIREEAEEIADKYFCNVRKVIVKVEE